MGALLNERTETRQPQQKEKKNELPSVRLLRQKNLSLSLSNSAFSNRPMTSQQAVEHVQRFTQYFPIWHHRFHSWLYAKWEGKKKAYKFHIDLEKFIFYYYLANNGENRILLETHLTVACLFFFSNFCVCHFIVLHVPLDLIGICRSFIQLRFHLSFSVLCLRSVYDEKLTERNIKRFGIVHRIPFLFHFLLFDMFFFLVLSPLRLYNSFNDTLHIRILGWREKKTIISIIHTNEIKQKKKKKQLVMKNSARVGIEVEQ